MNGSRHLLSLVSQMEKGCTVQSGQSRVTNEGDISAEKAGGGTDRQQAKTGERRANRKLNEMERLIIFCTAKCLYNL